MTLLTEIQADTFYFIREFIEENGYSPTRAEIAEHYDITGNAAQQRVEALIRKGAVTHKYGVMRSLRPTKGYRVSIEK